MLDQIDNYARDLFQVIERQRLTELLLANFVTRTGERQSAA
jgi:hypothetical protein